MQSAKLHQRRGSRSICATKLVSGSLFRLGGGAVAIALQWLSYRCAIRAHRLHAVGNAAARRWVCAACCEQASAAVRNGLCMRRCAPAFDRDLSGSWRQLAHTNVCSLGRYALARVLCSCSIDAVRNTTIKAHLTHRRGGLRLARSVARRYLHLCARAWHWLRYKQLELSATQG